MSIRRQAFGGCGIVAALLFTACDDTKFPVTPSPVVSTAPTVAGGTWSGSVLLGDGTITGFNMTLIARGLGVERRAVVEPRQGTIDVSGNFTTASGLRGTIEGTLEGTLHDGSFDGTLNSASPPCSRPYRGRVTESTVAWIPTGTAPPDCPLTFSVQLPRPLGTDCQYGVSFTRQAFSGNGGTGELTITTGPTCTWAAESLDDWLTVADPEPRTGPGSVAFTVQATSQAAREGKLRIAVANQTFTISQGQQCSYSISPTTVAVSSAGGTGTVTVTAPAGCEWSAETSVPWLSLVPASGSGTGTVTVTAQATSSVARQGSFVVAGQAITVSQGAGCFYDVTPAAVAVPAGGGTTALRVTTSDGCAWTATSGVPGIVLSPSSGVGPGTLSVLVPPNVGPQQTVTITVAGRTVAISQPSSCAFTITNDPPVAQPGTVGGAAQTGTITVAASSPLCSWTATAPTNLTPPNWFTFENGSGSITRVGSDRFTYTITPNAVVEGTTDERQTQILFTGDGSVRISIPIVQLGGFFAG